MNIFYSPNTANGIFYLDEEESRHAIKVLRLEERDIITIVDGKGSFYEAIITSANARKCEFSIKETKTFQPNSHFIHVAIAPTKNADRIEWFVEKAVEIGVDKISFIKCSRSERKNINTERIEKIVISAMKQSLKAYKPSIEELESFDKFVKNNKENKRYIAHLEDDRKDLLHVAPKKENYCILIGPEGDFTADEIKTARNSGFEAVSLGNSRLRTETAGVVACHILNIVNAL